MCKLFILVFSLCFTCFVNAQTITANIQPDAVYFLEDTDSILVYQKSEKSLDGAYARCHYIHPLYSLDGAVLTEDFPADHLHHRGIFWAWHQLYIGDTRIGDGWDIKDFSWEVTHVTVLDKAENAKSLQTEVLWKSPQWKDATGKEQPVVKEITTITIYPAEHSYRQIDFEISLLALEETMRLGGSENEKGYGGFSTRIKLPDAIAFTSSTGTVIPDNLPVWAGAWMDISGALGNNGSTAGISILCHPENPGYPNPWILRAAKSLQNAVYPYPGATAVPLSNTEPTVLRYRLLIHTGDSTALDIPEIYLDYKEN